MDFGKSVEEEKHGFRDKDECFKGFTFEDEDTLSNGTSDFFNVIGEVEEVIASSPAAI